MDSKQAVGPENGAVKPTYLSPAVRTKIFLYFAVLLTVLGFGAPVSGMIDIPVTFLLKNKLHLQATELANFRFWSGLPFYFSFLFGFLRDVWSPFGLRDRGYLILFGAITAALYACFAFVSVSYWTLFVGFLIVTTAYLFISSAWHGLVSTLGQQHVMSGQISAVWNGVGALIGIAAILLGGVLSDALEGRSAAEGAKVLFLIGSGLMALLALFGGWRPKSVFGNLRSERDASSSLGRDVARLFNHWPIYPAFLIWLLWNFAPGTQTVLQYYLSDKLFAKDVAWAAYNAIYAASFIPTFLIFGLLCQRVPLRTLLIWGTIIGIPQMLPLIFIHSANGVLASAVPIGLMGGMAEAAYLTLIIRSCPKGLQGTTMMLASGLTLLDSRLGNVLGTDLYEHHGGFVVCAVVSALVYALILPTLLLVPRNLIATADGEVLQDPSPAPIG